MIDIFTVVLPHALMAIAVWRLIHRDDLDKDPAPTDSGTVPAAPASATGWPRRAGGKPRA